MPLLTVAQLRSAVNTALTDTELAELIADEEAELVQRLGAHGDGVASVVERVSAAPLDGALFLSRPALSITSITSSGAAISATLYTSVAAGRVERVSGEWPAGPLLVTYVPQDDQAKRRRALIDLCRLTLQRTAMRAESVAGEYSYTAPDSWEAERARVYRRLTYMSM